MGWKGHHYQGRAAGPAFPTFFPLRAHTSWSLVLSRRAKSQPQFQVSFQVRQVLRSATTWWAAGKVTSSTSSWQLHEVWLCQWLQRSLNSPACKIKPLWTVWTVFINFWGLSWLLPGQLWASLGNAKALYQFNPQVWGKGLRGGSKSPGEQPFLGKWPKLTQKVENLYRPKIMKNSKQLPKNYLKGKPPVPGRNMN